MFSYIFGQLGRSRGFPQTFLRHVSMIVVKTSAVVSVASLTHPHFHCVRILYRFSSNDEKTDTTGERRENMRERRNVDERTSTKERLLTNDTNERALKCLQIVNRWFTSLVYRSRFQLIQYHYQHRPPIQPHPAPRMQMNRADQANPANSANSNRIAPIPRQRTIFLILPSNRDDRTHPRSPSPVDR